MRLKPEYIQWIKQSADECFGEGTRVYLFGSRTDDSRRGGDIDLFIETKQRGNLFEKKIKMLGILNKRLGEQKIDLIIKEDACRLPIYDIARKEGILL